MVRQSTGAVQDSGKDLGDGFASQDGDPARREAPASGSRPAARLFRRLRRARGMTERPRSAISTSTSDRITVRGLDLTTDLMGKVGLGDMAFLELLGRLPNSGESVVFNAMLVSLVEHGLTPNTLAARLTYLGSPEALQASVAAGVLGLGTVFVGSIEGAARMLQEALAEEGAGDDLQRLAGVIVEEHLSSRRSIPGLGHPIHRPVDPRARRLFELASENGLAGSYVELI